MFLTGTGCKLGAAAAYAEAGAVCAGATAVYAGYLSFSNGLKSGIELGNEKSSLELQLRNFAN